MTSKQDAVRQEMKKTADEQLVQSESFMDVPMEELMGWADLPELKDGEECPDWRRRLEDPEGWRELPLFMESVPENSTNPAVAALQDILYNEASPEEIAEKCKSQGNVSMKQVLVATGGTAGIKGPMRTALQFYTEGLLAKSSDRAVVGALHANRAQAHLGLGNYGHCVADCQDALHIRPNDVKCCFRAAKACNAVKKPTRSMMFVRRGLSIEPENKALLGQKKEAEALVKTLNRIEKATMKKKQAECAGWHESVQCLVDSGIKVGKGELRSEHWSQYGAKGPHLVEGELHMSMLFVYDEFSTSDFTVDVMLDHSLGDHLAQMLPPTGEAPTWDKVGRYTTDSVTAFYQVRGCIHTHTPPALHPSPPLQVGHKMREVTDLDEPFRRLLRREVCYCLFVAQGMAWRDTFTHPCTHAGLRLPWIPPDVPHHPEGRHVRRKVA